MAEKDKNEDEYKDNLENSSMDDDEDFGLPDLDDDSSDDIEESNTSMEDTELPSKEDIQEEIITFDDEPVESKEENSFLAEDDSLETDSTEYSDDDNYDSEEEGHEEDRVAYTPPKQSSAPIIITISIIVILACVAVYFFFIRDTTPPQPIVQEPVKDTTTYVVEKPVELEEPIEEPEEVIIEPTINTLNTRSGRSYVVVGSFFDDDLAMDYAKQLKKQGTSSYIIPPFGKSKFTRVAVQETESFADASSRAGDLAGQYKEQPWPLKY